MVSDIHWGLGTYPLWIGSLVFPWGYMAAGPIMPCWLLPAGSWLWAGGRGEWRKGREAEALQGLQSLPQLGPGFSAMTRRPTPHSKRHFPCAQPQMAQLCIGADPQQLPCAHGTQCTLIWVLVFQGSCLFACLFGLGWGFLFVFSFLICFVFST